MAARRDDTMTQASRICRAADGKWHSYDCLLRYSAPLPVDAAVERARQGRTVFVQREDVGQVLGMVQG